MSLKDSLTTYAKYHTQPMTKLTHCIGIPLILFGVQILLSLPTIAGYPAAWLVPVLLAPFYIWVSRLWGALTIVWLVAITILTTSLALVLTAKTCIILFLLTFIGGWILQFIGHHYEQNKPLFFENLIQALIGPVFVTKEIGEVLKSSNK